MKNDSKNDSKKVESLSKKQLIEQGMDFDPLYGLKPTPKTT